MLPMDPNISSPKASLSPCSDPEEKEISEDDDDDRNHKHRRRDDRSQSQEGDASEQVFTRPYRKRNKPFENGHSYREGGSQYGESWKNNNMFNQEREASGRFEKRRQHASFARAPFELSQRIRLNQSLPAEAGWTRGRGREPSSWNHSQLAQPGAVPPGFFGGRGLPNVSNTSWNSFGLMPAIPNGGIEPLHSIGIAGGLNSSMGIPRARCRDFEERGFCLRGDMCPMEHGVNRIVVEDVQSLSQFNLPVSLPGSHMLGMSGGQGPSPANVPPGTLSNKSLHNRTGKHGLGDNDGGSVAGGPDLYDPDQPLWANDSLDTSPALPAKVDKIDHLSDQDNSERLLVGQSASSDNGRLINNGGAAAASQSSIVWGRNNSSKTRSEMREKIDLNLISGSLDAERRKDLESSYGVQKGRAANADETGLQATGLPSNSHSESGRNSRKAPPKALRTLYVCGIPKKDNKGETLLSHFKKFGDVIDIHTPKVHPDRAFVQFSKREEAVAALKSPDAVLGNRFIRLQWANRDSVISDDALNGVSLPNPNPRGSAVTTTPTFPSGTSRGKDIVQISGSKNSVARPTITSLPGLDHQKPITNGAQATPPLQKKMETLELLKEELRKKQEMFDKKRSEFKRKLNKLEKQTSGPIDEVASDQSSKKQKGGTLVDVAKIEMSRSSSSGTVDSPRHVKVTTDPGFKSSSVATVPDPSTLKPSIRPLAPVGAPFVINRFKLDNRPTAFKVLPPLPPGLANVPALKEHFSAYGDPSLVEVEDAVPQDTGNEPETTNISARISFTNRHSAEMAFLNGKCWQGESLNFLWLPSSSRNASKDTSGKETSAATLKESSDAATQSGEEMAAAITTSSRDGDSESLERREDDGKSAATLKESPDAATQSGEVMTIAVTTSSGDGDSESLERREGDGKSLDQVGDLQSS